MRDCPSNDVSSVTTTVATREDALRLARGAVAARLAACVQIEPVSSVYVWQGKPCETDEQRLTFKTLPVHGAALWRWLKTHHPYELPELLTRPCQAEPGYAAWVAAQVGPPPAA